MHILYAILFFLALMAGCGYVATNPLATTGKEEVAIEMPRYLSEVYAGPWQVEIPFVWESGSDATELYAAVTDPKSDPPTILISRKVNRRDNIKFYNAGFYQSLRERGRMNLEMVIYAFKPAQWVVQSPDPVAMALEVVLSKSPDGKYFSVVNGEVEIEARIPVTVITGPPVISDDVWVEPGPMPQAWIVVDSMSSQVAVQGAWLKDKWVAQGTSGYVKTVQNGSTFQATFEVPIPPDLKLGDKFVTVFRARDSVGQSVDRTIGWIVAGSPGNLDLTQLSSGEADKVVKDYYLSWNRPDQPSLSAPLKAGNIGTKAQNSNPVYDWIDDVLTGGKK